MPSPHTPQRIVSLQPSATVILAAIGELDRVVACTKYCADVVPEVAHSSRLILADSWTANTEQIVAARPDLVIASVPYQEEAVIQILKSGARFLGLTPKTLAEIYTDIAIIAGAAGASQRGEEVITSMQRRIEDVRSMTNHLQRPRVFCEEWGKPLIASQAWVAELVEAAGGEFMGTPGRQISFEDTADTQPRSHRCSMVWRRRSRAAGKNHRQPRVATNCRGPGRSGLLHARRISQYARPYAASGPGCAGFRHPSRSFPRLK